MAEAGQRRGRKPQRANQGHRMSLGLKVTPDIKNRLDAAAKANGRTQSQEAEARLDRSFEREGLLDEIFDLTYRDPHLVSMLLILGEAMRDTLFAIHAAPDWIDNPTAFDEVARAAAEVLEGYRPPGDRSGPEIDERLGKPTHPGEAVARMIMFRVAEMPEPPYQWLSAARSRIGKTVERLRQKARSGQVMYVPKGTGDFDAFYNALNRPEEDDGGDTAQ